MDTTGRRALYVLAGIAALGVYITSCSLSRADWQREDMNRAINQTNFIVGEGCSGTLISLVHHLVLTNHHCIENYYSFVEREDVGQDGLVKKRRREERRDVPLTQRAYQGFRAVGSTQYLAELVFHRQKMDLALLRIRADIPQTIFSQVLKGGRDVQRGDTVYVVGNPMGLDATLTKGIVSSTTRMARVPWADGAEVPFIQVDAAVNPGNSGGALYNEDGQLIGVPAAAFTGLTGLGLAIPYTTVRQFLLEACYGDVWATLGPCPR